MIYIVTGPSHSGKSTYINEHKNENDVVIDIYDFQEDKHFLPELAQAHYDFLLQIELALMQRQDPRLGWLEIEPYDIWIEGCFSKPYRIAQIIDTIRTMEPHEEIELLYILRDEEWYDENCEDREVANYAKYQLDYYECYEPNRQKQPTICFITNDNIKFYYKKSEDY